MIRIKWMDGTEMADRSWAGLLRQINALPWNKDMAAWELRKVLQKRAYLWSMINIDTKGTAKDFMRELARAGAIKILEES